MTQFKTKVQQWRCFVVCHWQDTGEYYYVTNYVTYWHTASVLQFYSVTGAEHQNFRGRGGGGTKRMGAIWPLWPPVKSFNWAYWHFGPHNVPDLGPKLALFRTEIRNFHINSQHIGPKSGAFSWGLGPRPWICPWVIVNGLAPVAFNPHAQGKAPNCFM